MMREAPMAWETRSQAVARRGRWKRSGAYCTKSCRTGRRFSLVRIRGGRGRGWGRRNRWKAEVRDGVVGSGDICGSAGGAVSVPDGDWLMSQSSERSGSRLVRGEYEKPLICEVSGVVQMIT